MINFLSSKTALLFLLLFSCQLVSAQQDFNHYRSLRSSGPIPADFTVPTLEKVNEDILKKETKLTPTKERVFYESIHSSIDPILQSGLVTYGDELSLYVNSVVDRLLASEPELRSKLRFYTIKSNVTNALSTDQGIVFVTTGLISQLTSEAQLAYILSHEIAHYTEHHIMEGYESKGKSGSYSKKYGELTKRSRENELSADKIALNFYHKAGYSDEEVVSTFDVLMYSYLPFDEVIIPEGYFATDKMYIPDSYFTKESFPITAEEDYDDSGRSHPNIKSRKKAITGLLADYSDWGKEVNPSGEERFKNVREIARFESVRTAIVDAEYREALYAVFLLERKYPSSVYLQEMKAQAWFGVLQIAANESSSVERKGASEGEAAVLNAFLGKLSKKQRVTVAFRHLYDLQKQYPENKMIGMLLEKAMKVMAGSANFRLESYAKQDFRESSKPVVIANDSIAQARRDAEEVKSKYDKIKGKKNSAPTAADFDSTEFHLYALSDIVTDSIFVAKLKKYAADSEKEKETEEKLKAEQRGKKKKAKEDPLEDIPALDLSKAIVVEPSGTYYDKYGTYYWKPAAKTKELAGVASDLALSKEGISAVRIGSQEFDTTGTTGFNERSLLYGFLEQAVNYESKDFVPVDLDLLQELAKKYDTPYVIYSNTEYRREYLELNGAIMLGSFILWPTLPLTLLIYVPIKSSKANELTTTVLVLDLSGNVTGTGSVHSNSKPAAAKINKAYQQIFHKLAQPK